MAFEKLKIDAGFAKTMDVDAGSHKIVAPVIRSGHSLGMAAVAEDGGKMSVMPNALLQLLRSWTVSGPSIHR